MRLILKSTVDAELIGVFEKFDRELFEYLLPPGAELIAFGGSKKGDIVHLKLPLVGEWKSEIIEEGKNDDKCYFVDEGIKLPFPLKQWEHQHILCRRNNGTLIEDKISFSTGFFLTDILFYPVLFLSFIPRIWQYKSFFRN